jgi:hypothetical protein
MFWSDDDTTEITTDEFEWGPSDVESDSDSTDK